HARLDWQKRGPCLIPEQTVVKAREPPAPRPHCFAVRAPTGGSAVGPYPAWPDPLAVARHAHVRVAAAAAPLPVERDLAGWRGTAASPGDGHSLPRRRGQARKRVGALGSRGAWRTPGWSAPADGCGGPWPGEAAHAGPPLAEIFPGCRRLHRAACHA